LNPTVGGSSAHIRRRHSHQNEVADQQDDSSQSSGDVEESEPRAKQPREYIDIKRIEVK
jgi:hypothetical protein